MNKLETFSTREKALEYCQDEKSAEIFSQAVKNQMCDKILGEARQVLRSNYMSG